MINVLKEEQNQMKNHYQNQEKDHNNQIRVYELKLKEEMEKYKNKLELSNEAKNSNLNEKNRKIVILN